jgi:hypothetical protein
MHAFEQDTSRSALDSGGSSRSGSDLRCLVEQPAHIWSKWVMWVLLAGVVASLATVGFYFRCSFSLPE